MPDDFGTPPQRFEETITDAKILRVPVNGGAPETRLPLPFDEVGSIAMFPDGRRFVVSVYSSDMATADVLVARPREIPHDRNFAMDPRAFPNSAVLRSVATTQEGGAWSAGIEIEIDASAASSQVRTLINQYSP